jgi:hypothetical protein
LLMVIMMNGMMLWLRLLLLLLLLLHIDLIHPNSCSWDPHHVPVFILRYHHLVRIRIFGNTVHAVVHGLEYNPASIRTLALSRCWKSGVCAPECWPFHRISHLYR